MSPHTASSRREADPGMTPRARTASPEPDVEQTMVRDTFEEVYRAAVELIYEQGYHAASMREIATQVGVRTSSLYHHYSSKQELLAAIMERTMLALIKRVSVAIEGVASSQEKLRRAIEAHVMFHAMRSKEAGVTDTEYRALDASHRARIRELRRTYEGIFVSIIDEGQGTNEFIAADSKVVAYGLLAMCTGVAVWYRPTGRMSLPDIAKIYGDVALRGVRA